MKQFEFIVCLECGMQYEIVWDNDNYEEPSKCAGCGDAGVIEVIHSGVKM